MAEEKLYAKEAQAFGHAMNSIAYGNTLMAAARDYMKEALADQKGGGDSNGAAQLDMHELMEDGDADLQALHADRVAQLQAERERRQTMQMAGHGQYSEVAEGEFLEIVTKTDLVVCHFFHREFERCKIMDKHLADLAARHFKTRFIKISAPDAPFFTIKLNIKMLPCVVAFRGGVSVLRIVGFEVFGRDDFPTTVLEGMLLEAGAIEPPKRAEDEEERDGETARAVRKGFHNFKKTASDEDSDFDE